MNICCKYKGLKGRYVISYPRTLVWYCRFDTVFIFIVNLYKYQNVFQSIPTNIVGWLENTISYRIIDRVALFYVECFVVRNRQIRNMVLLRTFCLLLTCCLDFLISSMCVWLKNYCIVYLYTQTSQIDCFQSFD